MAEQSDDIYIRGGHPLPPSPSSTLSEPPSSPELDRTGESVQYTEGTQTESARKAARAGEYALDVVRRKKSYYERKSSLQLYIDRMDASKKHSFTSSKATKSTRRGPDAHPVGKPAAKLETPAKKPAKASTATSPPTNSGSPAPARGSSAPSQKDTPRVDRAGQPRPANKKFLPRDTTGKLVGEETGPDTQLEEVQAWIQEKKYTKFELLPDVDEYTFEDIDKDVRTEPFHLPNQGRKLVIGRDEEAEVCAILPSDDKKVYPCRFLLWDRAKGAYTAIKDMAQLRDSIDELYYPWEAFTHSVREDAWMQLQAVVCYVFLLCGEANVVYTTSAKNPGSLSTALTHIKETYAPNDAHPTAATVNRIIQTDDYYSDNDATQLEQVNELLSKKKLLDNMQRLVSDPSVYVFDDFTPNPTLKAKGIAKVHSRMLFLGENDEAETWVVPCRAPNKAILGWIININKETGEQEHASWWPSLPTLTFPFQAFQEKKDALNWRKLFYTVGYIFLYFGEAKVAVNMATSFQKHFVSVSVANTVEKFYGSISPPTGWPHVRKPGDFDLHDDDLAPVSSTGGQVDASIQPPKKGKQTAFSKHRKALREIKGRNTQPSISVSRGAHGVDNPRPPTTYIAPAGEYRSLDDLSVSLFLEKIHNSNGKRPASDNEDEDEDEDKENRPKKHKRLEAKRAEAAKLRLFQKREVEKMQRELDEKKRKLHLLEDAELGFASQMGQVMMGMTDEDFDALQQP
ncbi:hypothetical protein P171DRAFT_515649 [Karstenula rhodostoma CBS 690.94]|uniref:Uncharacterized protein n=1 Tax=Karstenula rhodostoma CBS 690.94 TaxID=1392251 RepID=A0A9P4PZE4_9PLEO|nr:hypothetical protein P171DRAFT_515649 [Karstenula rhodostoma CBS 690.94]